MPTATWIVICLGAFLLALYVGYVLTERSSARLKRQIRNDTCINLATMSDEEYAAVRDMYVDDQRVVLDVDRRHGQRLIADGDS